MDRIRMRTFAVVLAAIAFLAIGPKPGAGSHPLDGVSSGSHRAVIDPDGRC